MQSLKDSYFPLGALPVVITKVKKEQCRLTSSSSESTSVTQLPLPSLMAQPNIPFQLETLENRYLLTKLWYKAHIC